MCVCFIFGIRANLFVCVGNLFVFLCIYSWSLCLLVSVRAIDVW